jgi:hypothetical protein
MRSRYIHVAALAAGLLFAAGPGTCAQPTPGQAMPSVAAKPLPFVSPIFGDNMVLQRGKLDTIWGWSDPGDTVRVQIGDNTATATAGADHRWQVKIQPPAPGGPYIVRITGHQIEHGSPAPLCRGFFSSGRLPLRLKHMRATAAAPVVDWRQFRSQNGGGSMPRVLR